jgi:hypothetical protein
VLHLDATTIRADIDRDRVGQPDSPDPDARYGKFPGRGTAPGYKQHTVVDEKKRVVVGLSVTPADRHEHDGAVAIIDQALEQLDGTPEAICADAAYGSGRNRAAMEDRDIRLVSPPQRPMRPSGDHWFTIDDFTYDQQHDSYTCPAGATLHYVGIATGRADKRRYAALTQDCRGCPMKRRCTRASRRQLKVSIYRAAYLRLQADAQTDSFKALYRSRAPVVEGVFAEAKQWHGLRRAWRRGLAKMRVQCLLIAAVINFKRLITLFSLWNGFNNPFFSVFGCFWRASTVFPNRMQPNYAAAPKF